MLQAEPIVYICINLTVSCICNNTSANNLNLVHQL